VHKERVLYVCEISLMNTSHRLELSGHKVNFNTHVRSLKRLRPTWRRCHRGNADPECSSVTPKGSSVLQPSVQFLHMYTVHLTKRCFPEKEQFGVAVRLWIRTHFESQPDYRVSLSLYENNGMKLQNRSKIIILSPIMIDNFLFQSSQYPNLCS